MKPLAHIVENTLINPTNPVTINVIGTGGTGSQMLTSLARINHALLALNHPGLMVNAFDDDRISEANLGRQLFSESEVGLFKSVVLINRINRFFGTNWKARPHRFGDSLYHEDSYKANIFITCVDTAKSRFEISEILHEFSLQRAHDREHPLYWMDLGNSRDTGQVVLSTIGKLTQPESEKYDTIAELPFITEIFRAQLESADRSDDTPSCSLAEALTKQNLFINTAIATYGATLLWQMFQQGIIFNRGAFINLQTSITQPLKLA